MSTTSGRIVTVDDDAPADFNNIQAAINDANDGDVVEVQPGRYTGDGNRDISFLGKPVTVRGTDPNDPQIVAATVVDCDADWFDDHRGFIFDTNEGAGSILAGLTITNGCSRSGGGIRCKESSPTIRNCIFWNNSAAMGGGIVCYWAGELMITGCTFGVNKAGTGGAVFNWNSVASLVDCVFIANAASRGGGALYNDHSSVEVTNCVFIKNLANKGGGGMSNVSSELRLTNCALIANTADEDGGGIGNYDSDVNLVNCTFSGNSAADGNAIGCDSYMGRHPSRLQLANCILWDGGEEVWNADGSDITIVYSDVEGGWPGQGNIAGDPCFALAGDAHLMGGSACIDAGTDTPIGGPAETDIEGNPRTLDGDSDGNAVTDLGAYEYNPARPAIAVSTRSLSYVKGYTRCIRRLVIRNCGGGTLNWEVVTACDWLDVRPSAGVSNGEPCELGVAVDANSLAGGYHYAVLEVTDPNAVNGAVNVLVCLYVGHVLNVPADHNTIQAAIDAAREYDSVVIAPGTYTGEGNRDLDFAGKPLTVRCVDPTDPSIVAATIIDCNGTWQDPHRGFRFDSGEGPYSVLAGLTITNGFGPEEPVGHWPTHVGGAIFCNGSSPTITRCTITNNGADVWGGGIGCFFSSSPVVSECILTDNWARSGGGLYASDRSSPSVEGCTFSANHAWHGAGVYCAGTDSSLWMYDCSLSNNGAADNGGAIYLWRAGGTVADCDIRDNTAHTGAGVYCSVSDVNIVRCTLVRNAAYGVGGAICCSSDYGPWWPQSGKSPVISNCMLFANSAALGGGLYATTAAPSIQGSTFTGNSALGGSAIYSYASEILTRNCILWGEEGMTSSLIYLGPVVPSVGFPRVDPSTLRVGFSNIQGWTANIHVEPRSTVNLLVGNINQAPLLTADGHLRLGSACINAGHPTADYNDQTDIDGEIRVADGRVDMGADEYIDADFDGLPDFWELRYFGDVNSGDPNADPDQDGYPTLIEYELSSDPTEHGKTYCVDSNRPHDGGDGLSWATAKRTIQAAINTAGNTDRVVVAEGTYTGWGNRDLDLCGKWITVRCKNPADPNTVAATIIMCGGTSIYPHRGFIFHRNEGSNSIVEGFTIINGCARQGGAISCYNSSPVIRNCNISDSNATYGGAIDCNQSSPVIVDCNISGNRALETGGGIHCCNNSGPIISRCAIRHNSAGFQGGGIGAPSIPQNQCQVINCVITANSATSSGGGMAQCRGMISGCIISGNRAAEGGGLFNCIGAITNCTIVGNTTQALYRCRRNITNCIIWDNRPAFDDCVPYNCIEGTGDGLGCIRSDPCFVAPGFWDANGTTSHAGDDFWVDGDYRLRAESPCIDAGDSNRLPVDSADLDDDGNITEVMPLDLDGKARRTGRAVDIGPYEFPNTRPVAVAGSNQTVYAACRGTAQVTLDASACYDEDGDELTYTWSWTIDSNTYDANGVDPTIELPVGEHVITLVVNDAIEDSTPDECVITVVGPVHAQVAVLPRVINRRSQAKRIIAVMVLPEAISKDQVSRQRFTLFPGGVEAVHQMVMPRTINDTTRAMVICFFDKAEVLAAVPDDGRAQLQLAGHLTSGQYCCGSGAVWIRNSSQLERFWWPWR
jgi:hypothetical protein